MSSLNTSEMKLQEVYGTGLQTWRCRFFNLCQLQGAASFRQPGFEATSLYCPCLGPFSKSKGIKAAGSDIGMVEGHGRSTTFAQDSHLLPSSEHEPLTSSLARHTHLKKTGSTDELLATYAAP